MRAFLAVLTFVACAGGASACITPSDFDQPMPDPIIEEAPYPTLTFSGDGWGQKLRIGFDSALLADAAPLEDFPLLVRLVDDDGLFESPTDASDPAWEPIGDLTVVDFNLMNDGQDLRFVSPGGDLLAHEVETFDDTAKTARIWVRVPSLGTDADNDHIWLYYSNFQAPPLPAEAGAVWTTDYAGVWHMGMQGATANDSSQYRRDARTGEQPPDAVDGLGGGIAARFVGNWGAELTVDSIGRQMDSLTVDAVFAAAFDDGSAYTRWVANRPGAFELTTNEGGEGERWASFGLDTVRGENGWTHTGEVPAHRYQHVVGRFDAATGEVATFQQGVRSDTNQVAPTSVYPTGSALRIGEVLVGVIDELHISTVARSEHWIAAESAAYRGELTQSGASLARVERNTGKGLVELGISVRDGEEKTLMLLGVAVEGAAAVTRVEGLGLSWTLLETKCAGDGTAHLEVWSGTGVATSGVVQVQLDDPNAASEAMLAYLRGVTGEPQWGTPTARNTATTGLCIGAATPSSDVGGAVDRDTRNGFVVRFVSTGGTEFTETTPGFEPALAHQPGPTPLGVALSTGRRHPEPTIQFSGTLAQPVSWAQIALEVRE